jgi:hypothetical protein
MAPPIGCATVADERGNHSQGRMTRLLRVVCGVVLLALLNACVVVPQVRERYDADCRMLRRHITLEAAYVGGVPRYCVGDGCAIYLAAAGLVTAASVVVSGSIAIVGNALYWTEEQKQCGRGPEKGPEKDQERGAERGATPVPN